MDFEDCVGEGGVSGTLLPPLRAGCRALGTEGLRCRCRAASGSSAPLAAASLGCRARNSELDSDSSGVPSRAPPGCASTNSCGRPPVDATNSEQIEEKGEKDRETMRQQLQRPPGGRWLHTNVGTSRLAGRCSTICYTRPLGQTLPTVDELLPKVRARPHLSRWECAGRRSTARRQRMWTWSPTCREHAACLSAAAWLAARWSPASAAGHCKMGKSHT